MPLTNCPECGRQVSTEAQACPACGYPVAQKMAAVAPAAPSSELLAQVRPSWWSFFWYLFFFWLIVPLIIALVRRASIVLRVYPGRIVLERGLLSKCYREFMARDIRSIDIDQSLLARMVNIGDITISTAATVDPAEHMKGVPDPKTIRDLILAQRGDK